MDFQAQKTIKSICNVVHSWMGYIYEVSSTKHFAAESSLRYPIVGYLERLGAIIEMEEKHPIFPGSQIDFKWTLKDNVSYMEMKYVRNRTINIQSIYDDIFRLALIPEENAHKYFLICGENHDFETHIRNRTISDVVIPTEGHEEVKISNSGKRNVYAFDNILSFSTQGGSKPETNSNISEKTNEFDIKNVYYNDFKQRYDVKCLKDNALPSNLNIKSILLQPVNMGLSSAVGLWEIQNIKDDKCKIY